MQQAETSKMYMFIKSLQKSYKPVCFKGTTFPDSMTVNTHEQLYAFFLFFKFERDGYKI